VKEVIRNRKSGFFLRSCRRIVSSRMGRKITQKDMSIMLGVTSLYVSKLERGVKIPSDSTRIKYWAITREKSLEEIFINTLDKKNSENYKQHKEIMKNNYNI
jgi:transcriptional regulator with XRE-family HTH domain